MKHHIKNTVSLVLSLILLLGFIISATSCLYTFKVLTGPESGANNNNTQSGGSSNNGGSSSDSTAGTQNGATDGSSNQVQFCPGTNDPALTDGLLPEMRALLSTVAIDAKLDVYSSYPYYDTGSTTEYTSYGSGVIYSLDREAGDAYILTNYHVVYNKDEVAPGGFSDSISLYLYGMEDKQYAIPAKVVGGSMTYDIAVLKVENSDVIKNSMALAANLANSENVRVYDEVFAVGNPEGYGISATNGIVSVESESLGMTGADNRTAITLRVIRVSAAINDGNSGGGLYDTDGRLIGIVNAKRTGSEVDNIGYAIPINLAKNLAENIIRNCDGASNLSVLKCVIGIELAAGSSGLVTDGEGHLVIVEQVEVTGIKEACVTDKIAVGDIINSVTIDGNKTEVTRTHHIIDAMLTANVGSTVIINVTRGTETMDITVTIPESALTTVK